MQLAGFTDISEISTNDYFVTLKATSSKDGEVVTLKLLPDAHEKIEQALSLRHEFEILNKLSHPQIPLAKELLSIEKNFVLVREHKDGILLKDFIRNFNPTIYIKLKIAQQILRIIDHLHTHSIIHKNINPYNILIDRDKLEISLVNFGNSSVLTLESQDFVPVTLLEENLVYCAPEQTGRVRRRIDYRTDYYSFGNTLYELLTGQPPFYSNDPLELVHAQIAKLPTPPHVISNKIPRVVSDIVYKLIAKNPGDRYQSIQGIRHDIQKCIDILESSSEVGHFKIGSAEVFDRFQIPQRLYGRQEETAKLLEAYNNVIYRPPQCVLVSGYSGIGKTSLISEIYRPVTQSRGIFISGKADQFQRSYPYSALLDAFDDFVNYVLRVNPDEFNYWKDRINTYTGDNAAILAHELPRLELVLGPQQVADEISATEIELKFNQVIKDFLDCIASPDHPLVLFIDDLQWVDLATIKMIENLINWQHPENLMIIGAYRDNEINESHPVALMLDKLRKHPTPPVEIKLTPLSRSDVNFFVADTLFLPVQQTGELADLIYAKTHGNPFFTIQLLTSLHDEDLISYNHDARHWEWDIEGIQSLNVSDNVVDLMVKKIGNLPGETRDVLIAAACIGNSFYLDLLATAIDKTVIDTFNILKPAISQSCIEPPARVFKVISLSGDAETLPPDIDPSVIQDEKYHFIHDRVQQAAYLLIPDTERETYHLKIARLLFNYLSEQTRDDVLFDVVSQYKAGLSLVDDADEKLNISGLNLEAGVRAKQSNALDLAIEFLRTGIKLLPEKSWTDHYELTWNLHTELAECESLSGNHEEAEIYFRLAHKNTRTPLERLHLSRIRCALYTKVHSYQEALDVAHEALAEYGIRFPSSRPMQKLGAVRKILESWLMLRRKVSSWDKIADLPLSNDPEHVAITDLLTETGVAAYTLNQEIMVMSMLETLKLGLKRGMTGSTTWSMMSFAVIIGSTFKKYRTGYEIGESTRILFDRVCSKVQKWKTSIVHPAFVDHWIIPRRENLDPFWEVYRGCVQHGEQPMAATSLVIHTTTSIACGDNLADLNDDILKKIKLLNQIRSDHGLILITSWFQYVKALAGETIRLGSMDNDDFSEDVHKERISYAPTSEAHFGAARMMLHFFDHNDTEALVWGKSMEPLEAFLLGQIVVPEYVFFYTLVINRALASDEPRTEKGLGKALRNNLSRLKTWTKFSPENFQHQYDLARAQIAHRKGQYHKALQLFESSIAGAKRSGFTHHLAVAYELAGEAMLKQGNTYIGEIYLQEAWNAYGEWGAKAKQAKLAEMYPGLMRDSLTSSITSSDAQRTSSQQSQIEDTLNLNSLLKASQSLSGEIKFDLLIEKLMFILLENAGAEKACLVLNDGQILTLAAEATVSDSSARFLSEQITNQSNQLPVSVVYYCVHTREPMVLNNASHEGMFTEDPYIKRRQVASVLCYPIVHQNKIPGLIYLENNLVTGAFTDLRLEILRLLSSQIAISLENATLYEQLEEKVRQRTATIEAQKDEIESQKEALELEKKKADELLLNILPTDIAEELKQEGKAQPKHHPAITVMFTDFEGFTHMAREMNPEQLVERIDNYFGKFDEIIDKYNIEKIKTIGDAYMCASGLPNAHPDHARVMIDAAIEIQQFLDTDRRKREESGEPVFNARIGIHSGPVVAGVVGSKKFAYDIWGDTVNVASRLENACEQNMINISGDTYELINTSYTCKHRGPIEVKHGRQLEMYYVEF